MNTARILSSATEQLAAFAGAAVVTLSVLSALVQVAGGYRAEEQMAAARQATPASQQVVVLSRRANGG